MNDLPIPDGAICKICIHVRPAGILRYTCSCPDHITFDYVVGHWNQANCEEFNNEGQCENFEKREQSSG